MKNKLKMRVMSAAMVLGMGMLAMPLTVQAGNSGPGFQKTIDWMADFLKRKGTCLEAQGNVTKHFNRVSYSSKDGMLWFRGNMTDISEGDEQTGSQTIVFPIAKLDRVLTNTDGQCFSVTAVLNDNVMRRKVVAEGFVEGWQRSNGSFTNMAYFHTKEDAERLAKALNYLSKIAPKIKSKELF